MSRRLGESSITATAPLYNCNCKERIEESEHQHLTPVDRESIERKMVFLTNESANKVEIDILSARDTTRPR